MVAIPKENKGVRTKSIFQSKSHENIGCLTYLSSDNVTDLHGMVVHHIGEVISWIAVILQDHLVVDVLVIKDDLTVDYVTESCFTFRDFHSDDIRLPICFLFF